MFILRNKEQITKAIENAKALHPKVRMIEFGEYEVSGSEGQHLHGAVLPRCRREDR